MKRFFMDDEATISRWRYAAGLIGMALLWGITLTVVSGILG